MKTQALKKLAAVCLVLAVSSAAWACGGNKGGSCGDKDKKDTSVITAQVEADRLTACENKDKEGGCKGSDSGTKEK